MVQVTTGFNYSGRTGRSKAAAGPRGGTLPFVTEPERLPSNVLKRPLKLAPMKRIKR